MTKVYIAGKITGLDPQEVEDKFSLAARKIALMGFEPVNPAAGVKTFGTSSEHWNFWMKAGLRKLLECDAIYLLPDWQESSGAKIEKMIADIVNMPTLFELEERQNFEPFLVKSYSNNNQENESTEN